MISPLLRKILTEFFHLSFKEFTWSPDGASVALSPVVPDDQGGGVFRLYKADVTAGVAEEILPRGEGATRLIQRGVPDGQLDCVFAESVIGNCTT